MWWFGIFFVFVIETFKMVSADDEAIALRVFICAYMGAWEGNIKHAF